LLLAATVTSVLLVYLPFLRIDPDPHHDGLVLKNAMDVTHGMTLFSQSFNQYGALFVFTNAVGLATFGDHLIVLRVLNVLLLALAAGLVMWAWSSFMSRLLAVGAVALMIVLDPVFRNEGLLPWSSLQVIFWTAAVVACLVFLLQPITGKLRLLVAAGGGVSVAAVILLRVNTGGAIAVAVLLALAIRHFALKGVARSEALAWIGGLLVPLAIFGVWLVANGAVSPFWIQSVSLPRRWYPPIASGAHVTTMLIKGFKEAIERLGFAGPVTLGLVVAVFDQNVRRRVVGALASATALAIMVAFNKWPLVRQLLSWNSLFYELPLIAVVGGIVVGVTTMLHVRVKPVGVSLRPRPDGIGRAGDPVAYRAVALISCGLVGVTGIVQYYPLNDPRHLFWGVALVVGPAVGAVALVGRRWLAGIFVVGCLVSLVPSAVDISETHLSVPRFNAPSVLVSLQGMQISTAEWEVWGRVLDDLGALTRRHPNTPVLVYGPDALPATLAGDLSNPDPYFVEWGPYTFDVPFGSASIPVPWNLGARDRFIRARRPIVWFARGNPQMQPFLRRYDYVTVPSPQPECGIVGLPTYACPIIATPAEWSQANRLRGSRRG
jgi:hypothetical protein